MTGSQLILTWMLAVLAGFATLIFYITIIKPTQDEKKESQGKSGQDQDVDTGEYSDIIDDYPTYNRQK
jgi:hypothetical protein